MANIRTYDITFAPLSEYSAPISVYSSSLLQPMSISVGYWFPTGSGTVSLLASYDNIIYTSAFSTTASNNSVIYLSIPSFVGAFIKIQRSVSPLTLSGESINNALVTSSESSSTIVFSVPLYIQINDEIWANSLDDTLVFLGKSQQSSAQSLSCTFVYPPAYTLTNRAVTIIRNAPLTTGVLTCSFIQPSIVSVTINKEES